MSDIPEVFAIFEQKLAHVLSFNLRQKGQKKAIEELLAYFSGIVERASKAESRIAELEGERRWKDSNVELPKEDTDGNALLVICRYSGEWARAPFGIEFSDEFVRHYSHWMIAPQLPEVQE